MAILFGVDRTRIVRHIANIYRDGELDELSTSAENAQVRLEGNREIKRTVKKIRMPRASSICPCSLKRALIQSKVAV